MQCRMYVSKCKYDSLLHILRTYLNNNRFSLLAQQQTEAKQKHYGIHTNKKSLTVCTQCLNDRKVKQRCAKALILM